MNAEDNNDNLKSNFSLHVACSDYSTQTVKIKTTYVTGPGKTGLMCTSTVFHFLSVRESYTHALPRNTKYLMIDSQVCFHRRLFTDAIKP